MPDPLIGARALPPVSILQMILEGPKGYFGRRGQMEDTQWLQQQQQQQQGAYAQNLIKTPEWNQAMGSPYDRQAQGGLWALTQGGPGTIPTQGGNWLQSVIGGAYGREQATFEDALQKSRIHMTTDEALRLERGKIDIANKQLQDQMKLFMPDQQGGPSPAQSQGINNIRYDMMAHSFGLKPRQDGYSWNPQNAMMEPTYGGPVWQKMTDELTPLQQTQNAVKALQDMDANGVSDVGKHQVLIATVQDGLRTANKYGSLDEGTTKFLSNYISEYDALTGYGKNPVGGRNFAIAQEKLKALGDKTSKQLVDWQRKYMVDPKGLGDPYYTPPIGSTKPSQKALDAVKQLNEGAADRGGKVGAGGMPSYGQPSGPKPDEKPKLKSRQDELKKKFPGARFGN